MLIFDHLITLADIIDQLLSVKNDDMVAHIVIMLISCSRCSQNSRIVFSV